MMQIIDNHPYEEMLWIFLNTFRISGSALQAQTLRLNTISSNLANVETTSTPEGGPYKKKSVYFSIRSTLISGAARTEI